MRFLARKHEHALRREAGRTGRPAAPVLARMEEDLATGEFAFVHVEDAGFGLMTHFRMPGAAGSVTTREKGG